MEATLDPTRSGKFPVYFNAEPSPKYASVRFNQKPSYPTSSNHTTRIQRSANSSSAVTLKIDDGSNKTHSLYEGRQKSIRTSYILSFDHTNQQFTLNPLSSEYDFNLISTQDNHDTKALREKYRQIELDDDAHASTTATNVSGGEDEANGPFEEEEHIAANGPDPKNPFDYRNHIGIDTSPQVQPTIASSASTKQAIGPTSAPLASPSGPSKAGPARPRKQDTSSPILAAPPRRQRSLSKIRTQRRPFARAAPDINVNPPTATSPHAPGLPGKAQGTDSSDAELDAVATDIEAAFDDDTNDDGDGNGNGNGDGGLTLDFDTGGGDGGGGRRNQRNLGFLTPQAGPISLRNAASMSPASVAARSPVRPGDGGSGYEEDDEDEDDKDDVDVDDLVLGSPAQGQSRQTARANEDVEMEDEDDEDNEFEKEMEKALEDDDMDEEMQDTQTNAFEQNRAAEESEEESEEE